VVTDRAAVDRIERAFNALPVSYLGTHGCTLSPGYKLEFKTTKDSPADVVVIALCGRASVKINGKAAATLDGFESTVAKLFGD
jgi:hypothetical protein